MGCALIARASARRPPLLDAVRSSLLSTLLTAIIAGAALAQPLATPSPGERIYRQGLLPSGLPVVATRPGQPAMKGRDVACVQCHQRSGLGMVEGTRVIPPIAGRVLFQPGQRIWRDEAMHSGGTTLLPTPPDRSAYDEASAMRAIREGIGAGGKPLDYLMPRYALDNATLKLLIDYLRHLSAARERSVVEGVIHFATIVAPDADPASAKAMIEVIQQYFATKNSSFSGDAASPLVQGGRPARINTQRRWQLHVWNLTGPPSGWQEQLNRRLLGEPVFAVISGIGGTTWEPVHRFCEDKAVPCLFPNVDLAASDPGDFYTMYFSDGVRLEARMMAARLVARAGEAPKSGRVVQVFRDDDIGASAAAELTRAAAGSRRIVEHALRKDGGAAASLTAAMADVRPDDVLVLWLRPEDLAALPPRPPDARSIFLSGLMADLDRAPLPAAWRPLTLMAYPVELPDRRSLRLSYPLGWFHLRGIPLVDERVQVNAYVACSVLNESLASMLDDFVRDFLVERVQMMLDSRLVDGYYSHLSLAQGQHFASKGGYIVHFADAEGTRLAADSDWIVP